VLHVKLKFHQQSFVDVDRALRRFASGYSASRVSVHYVS